MNLLSTHRIGDHLVGFSVGTHEPHALYTTLQIEPERHCLCVEVHKGSFVPQTAALRWRGEAYEDLVDGLRLDLKLHPGNETLRRV